MFFVGATGHLLTLVLTVCLPFVFLISGHQKIDVQSPANYVSEIQIQVEKVSTEISVVHYYADFDEKEINHYFVFDDFFDLLEFPDDNLNFSWKSVYSKSSGNKAPPVLHNFSC